VRIKRENDNKVYDQLSEAQDRKWTEFMSCRRKIDLTVPVGLLCIYMSNRERLGHPIELVGILHRFSSAVHTYFQPPSVILATNPRLFSLLEEDRKQFPTPYAVGAAIGNKIWGKCRQQADSLLAI